MDPSFSSNRPKCILKNLNLQRRMGIKLYLILRIVCCILLSPSYRASNFHRRFWWGWPTKLRPNDPAPSTFLAHVYLNMLKWLQQLWYPKICQSQDLSFIHTMKKFHLKKGFAILSRSPFDCILKLAPTLCCPLMMKNFIDAMSS
jgi:hypothetical protein